MKRVVFFLCLVVFAVNPVHGQQGKNPQILQAFRPVVAKPSQSTVRVLADGKEAALGVVISPDGWILTKHSELKGELVCKLPGGATHDAKLVGFDEPCDLAMLKIDAKGLTPIVFAESKISKVGHWVASPGTEMDPVAVGVVSVLAREIKGAKKLIKPATGGGYLGVALDLNFAGVKVEEVFPNNAAQKAGLKVGDQIIALNGEAVEGVDEFRALLSRNKPGDDVKLKIVRDEKEKELTAKLTTPPGAKAGKSRGDIQNNMGSKLSERRSGFPIILQHDSVLRPNDCGGPLCNLDGQVIGINIARAGRTESYAIPSEAVRPLLEKLKTQ